MFINVNPQVCLFFLFGQELGGHWYCYGGGDEACQHQSGRK